MDNYSQQELDQIAEYKRRLEMGLNPDPLINKVDLEEIAGSENFNRISAIEKINQISKSTVRNFDFLFYTPSKRLLWQAFGQEFIEPELLDFIDSIPSDETYFDIGASNGIFALYAAATEKKVVCFEPEVTNFALLNYNTYLNQHQHKHAALNFNLALSDTTELGFIFIEKFEAGGHLKILDNPLKRGDKKFSPDFKQAILKYTLDDFIKLTKINPPNFMKIDVDGCEQQVLRGMSKTLNNMNLKKIFIELEEDGENFLECEKILLDNGFHIQSRKRVQNYFGEENFIFAR